MFTPREVLPLGGAAKISVAQILSDLATPMPISKLAMSAPSGDGRDGCRFQIEPEARR
jgi:hypothetical protein